MSRVIVGISFWVCWLLISGCKPPVSSSDPVEPVLTVDALDGEKALAYVRGLVAITPRDSGTLEAEKAAQWIHDTMSPFADTCEIDTFTDATPVGDVTFHNVIATLKGKGQGVVMLGSHFDTKSGISETFQGANDSGSSTGLLIELARVLRSQPRLPFDVVFAFFDGEECMRTYAPNDGLHGSRHYAAQLEKAGMLKTIRAMIVLDMIGDKDLTVTIPRNTTKELAGLAFQAATAEGIRKKFGLARGDVLDDHVPFYKRDVPTLNLIDFEYGSSPGRNDHWHTDQDSLENISAESLQHIGRVTLRILNALAAD